MASDRPRKQEDAEWAVHGERTVYESRWVDLTLVDVEPPGGARFEHHVLRMQRVAVAVVLDESQENVLMLRRHRFIDDTWGWEVPVGIVEEDETAERAAYREVEEETGWRPVSLQHMITFQPAIGIADSPHEVFAGIGAVHVSSEIDPSEAAAVEWISAANILGLIDRGEIRDAATLVALLHLLARRSSP